VLKGQGFSEKSMVALSRAGKVSVLPREKVTYLNETTLAIDVVTKGMPGEWAVQVGSEDNRHSKVLFFEVIQANKQQAKESPRPMAATKDVKSLTKSKPNPSLVGAHRTAKVDTNKKAKTGDRVELLGNEWLGEQPKGNYTLQLLVSSSRYNLTLFVKKHHGLADPLAAYAINKDGAHLQVLTMGSYPSREAAEQAASALPSGVKGWPRGMGSVQQMMLPEKVAQQSREVKPGGGAEGARYKDTAWVWSQNPGHYTVQLAAAENEAAIDTVMYGISLPGELAVVQTLRSGKIWYVLIYGSFADREATAGTIERLPEGLKQNKPWPRRFASLQGELSRATPH